MIFFDKDKNLDSERDASKKNQPRDQVSWLENLEQMRAQRKKKQPAKTKNSTVNNIDIDALASSAIKFQKNTAQRKNNSLLHTNINKQIKDKVYRHYIKQWQQKHNEYIAEDSERQILLAGAWTLQADTILLQADGSDNNEVEILQMDEQQNLQQVAPQDADDTINSLNNDAEEAEALLNPEHRLQVTIVKPDLDPNKNLCVVNEQEFIEILKEKLKPHLQDMLEGAVKTMLLKNYEIMLACIQTEMEREIPKLIDDILEHNLKKSLK